MPGCSRSFMNLCAMAVLLAGTAGATEQEYTIKANSDLVVLDISVKDTSGQYVSGLTSNNFQVYDDNRAEKITYFSKVDTPATVGLILDNSGSMASKRRDVITAGLSFAHASNPNDEFFVLNFNDRLEYGLPRSVPFTDNINQLHHALNWGRPQGQTRLYDAVSEALKHMTESTQQYRVLIVVSDGGDNASRTPFPDLMKQVEESRATVFTVGLMDPADHDLNPSVLKKMAKASGGAYFQPESLEDVGPIFKEISEDIRHRYVLGYVPDESNDNRNVRSVKVKATEDGHKLAVRTRTSYVLDPAREAVASEGSKHVL